MARANRTAKPRASKRFNPKVEGEFDSGVGLYGGSELPLPSNEIKPYPKIPQSGAEGPCIMCGSADWEFIVWDDGLSRTSCCSCH